MAVSNGKTWKENLGLTLCIFTVWCFHFFYFFFTLEALDPALQTSWFQTAQTMPLWPLSSRTTTPSAGKMEVVFGVIACVAVADSEAPLFAQLKTQTGVLSEPGGYETTDWEYEY